jgi:hypothetical protein
VLVDITGENVFTDATFSGDEDLGAADSNSAGHVAHSTHCVAVADE